MLDAGPDAGLEVGCWDQVHPGAEDGFQFGLDPAQPEEAQAGRQVGEQVHVTVGAVLAAGDAAEYPQVRYPVGRIPVRRAVGRQSVLRAGAVSAHYLPSLGYEPRNAVSGVAHGF